ncbi:Lipid phosphate phosphatase delta [Zea mays]|uniref:Lipid phosphate phosphatase delta n=1 Tax=Zea mays TaxID=4577 RepID=A0A1D6L3Q2_MAIZE|nr:Lipid phosphate phosphatase delta [Zea mays]
MPARASPVMPMDERREMDPVADAHRVAWLQHGLLVLLHIHPIRLHLHGDVAVHRPTTEDNCYYLGCHLTNIKAMRNLFVDAFTLKKYVAKGVDVMVVRELNGGVDDERARQGRADGERDAQGAHDRTSQIAHVAYCASEKKVHMSI